MNEKERTGIGMMLFIVTLLLLKDATALQFIVFAVMSYIFYVMLVARSDK